MSVPKAPEVDPASVVWPAGDLGLPQRRAAILMGLVDAYHLAELTVGALDALRHRPARPYLLARDQFGKPHDLAAPTLAVVAGRLAALKQQLMNHLMEQGVVVGEQQPVILGHIECDGAVSAVGAGVRAERQALAEWLRVGDDHRHRPQPAAKIDLVEFHPALDGLGAERPPGLSGEAFHIAKRKTFHLKRIKSFCAAKPAQKLGWPTRARRFVGGRTYMEISGG